MFFSDLSRYHDSMFEEVAEDGIGRAGLVGLRTGIEQLHASFFCSGSFHDGIGTTLTAYLSRSV